MKILIVSVLLLMSSSAFAVRIESSCNFRKCGTEGWESYSWTGNYRSQTSCVNSDCFMNGWRTNDDRGGSILVDCNQGGCWTQGWHTTIQYPPGYPRPTGFEVVNCFDADCLKNGWWISTDYGTRRVSCINKDCAHNGWETYGPGSAWSHTGCKLSNCFQDGWTTDAY